MLQRYSTGDSPTPTPTPTLSLRPRKGSFEITNDDDDDDDDDDDGQASQQLPLESSAGSSLLSPALQSLPCSALSQEIMKQNSRSRTSSRDRVVWDEENLHELETSKTPKQKITEPKTPYYAPDGAGDGGLSPTPNNDRMQLDSATHAEAVRHALFEVATEEKASSSQSSGGNVSEEEEDYMERGNEGSNSDIRRSGSFEEHRRKHYDNEYRKAKLLASQSELAADDDEAAANGEDESVSVAVKRSLQL